MLRTFDMKSPREGGRERSRWPVFETDVGTIDGQLVVVLGSGVGSGNVNRGDETCRKEGREGLLEDVDGASCTVVHVACTLMKDIFTFRNGTKRYARQG